MEPITKNIRVVDEQGNEYEATYPKRANGLVKNGRARFMDQNSICLACPPNEFLEDIIMEHKTEKNDIQFAREQIEKLVAMLEKPNIAGDSNVFCNPELFSQATAMMKTYLETSRKFAPAPDELNMNYVASRIDQIISDTAYLFEAIETVRNIETGQPSKNADADTSRGDAITVIVQSRETTNQQVLRLLEKMYDDLKPKKEPDEITKFRELTDALCKYPSETAADILKRAAERMFWKIED